MKNFLRLWFWELPSALTYLANAAGQVLSTFALTGQKSILWAYLDSSTIRNHTEIASVMLATHRAANRDAGEQLLDRVRAAWKLADHAPRQNVVPIEKPAGIILP